MNNYRNTMGCLARSMMHITQHRACNLLLTFRSRRLQCLPALPHPLRWSSNLWSLLLPAHARKKQANRSKISSWIPILIGVLGVCWDFRARRKCPPAPSMPMRRWGCTRLPTSARMQYQHEYQCSTMGNRTQSNPGPPPLVPERKTYSYETDE